MLFPERLRQLRRESGLKQKEIAKCIGVDIPMYSRYEHGERRPKREQVMKLARLFKTNSNELVAMWLAHTAMNEIGNDPLANQALMLLNHELGNDDKAMGTESYTKVAPKESKPLLPIVPRTLVRELGDTPFPQYHEGDALEVLNRVEDDSVDCVVTCPPYWSLRRYGTDGIATDNIEEHVAQIVAVMGQVKRVLKPCGSLWLNMGDAYHNKGLQGLPWQVALSMIKEQGWVMRNDVVWDKQNSSFDSSTDHLRNVHEYVFHFVKSDDFYYNDEELRLYFNRMNERRKDEGKTTSGVTGARYRNNIEQSTALTAQEKEQAHARLNQVVAMVNNGEIPDFRMFLRENQGQVLDSKSEKAKSINEKGFYFLLYNKNGTMPGDVWTILPEKSNIERYNVFPEDLCRLAILATCPHGGLVLDPYCGTGTTCKVACELHRQSMGIDKNAQYLQEARNRVQQQPLSLF